MTLHFCLQDIAIGEMESLISDDLLSPLTTILLLLLLLSIPNIRLVYQVKLSIHLSLDFVAAIFKVIKY